MLKKKLVGTIRHYYSNIGVAIVKLESDIKVGDKILIEGKTKSFEQVVSSMQINMEPINSASKGQEIGMKVDNPVNNGYKIYIT